MKIRMMRKLLAAPPSDPSEIVSVATKRLIVVGFWGFGFWGFGFLLGLLGFLGVFVWGGFGFLFGFLLLLFGGGGVWGWGWGECGAARSTEVPQV